jgi:hypothetical protein
MKNLAFRASKAVLLLLSLFMTTQLHAQYTPPTVVYQGDFFGNLHRPFDWDGDGDLDLLGGKKIGERSLLLLYENVGGGHLAPPGTIGQFPYGYHGCEQSCVPLADFNADGRMDLVAQFIDTVLVYLQDNDGVLHETQRILSEGINTPDVATADFDGDGDLDIGYYHSGGLCWGRNDGTGHFQGQFFIASPPQNFISLFTIYGDVNADGLSDMLLYDYQNGDTLDLYLNGGAQFIQKSIPISTLSPGDYYTVQMTDLDGDGLPDLLPFPNAKRLEYWFKNLGNGDFSTAIPLLTNPGPDQGSNTPLLTTDMDADGDTDILCRMTDTLAWYENDANGVFSFHFSLFERGLQDLRVATVGDWDEDGLSDILCTQDYVDAGSMTFVRNLGNGQYAPRHYIAPDFVQIQDVRATDLNNDGNKDLLIASHLDHKLAWYPNLGNNQWGQQRLIDSLQFNQTFVLAADLDGDGDQDIVNAWDVADQFAYRNQIFIHNNLGGGQFGPAQQPLPNVPLYTEKAWAADMDADSDLDLAFLFMGAIPTIAWLPNDGTGQFGFPVFAAFSDGVYNLLEAVDMDKDGDVDLVCQRIGGLFWYPNDGTGAFGDPILLSTAQMFWPKVADMDGDDLPDLLYGGIPSVLVWARNPGTGDTLEAPRIILASPPANLVTGRPYNVSDFNGDGYNDILGLFYDYTYGWIPNLGEGKAFGEHVVLGASSYGVFDGADLNNDGMQDYIVGGLKQLQYHTGLDELPTVRGLFFRDDNENGQQDPTEALLPGLTATLSPASVLSVSDGQGEFEFLAGQGAYTLGFKSDSCWALTTDSMVFHVSVPTDPAALYRFGLRPNLNSAKIAPWVSSSQPICGQTVPFWLILRNDGCHPARARLHFFPGDLVAFESASPAPANVGTNEIIWESDTLLQPGQTRLVTAFIQIAPAVAGNYPVVRAVSETISPDGTVLLRQDTFDYGFEVLCSFDPNDKLVNISELPPAYSADSAELRYTIRFQNTGNFMAFNIRIRDTLDAALDWAAFRPLAASHAHTTTLDAASGVLTFTFPNILLPDSTSNEPESHGFVSFSIRLKPGLAPGGQTRNRAGIYFDINPPVITNWTETKVRLPSSVGHSAIASPIRVSPNPTSGMLRIFSENNEAPLRAEVFDMTGNVVLTKIFPPDSLSLSIDVAGLPPAVYWLRLHAPNGPCKQCFFVKI